MAKKKAPPSRVKTLVRVTYGRGKKAKSVDVEVTVDFPAIRKLSEESWSAVVVEEAEYLATQEELRLKVLDKKTLTKALMAWRKGY